MPRLASAQPPPVHGDVQRRLECGGLARERVAVGCAAEQPRRRGLRRAARGGAGRDVQPVLGRAPAGEPGGRMGMDRAPGQQAEQAQPGVPGHVDLVRKLHQRPGVERPRRQHPASRGSGWGGNGRGRAGNGDPAGVVPRQHCGQHRPVPPRHRPSTPRRSGPGPGGPARRRAAGRPRPRRRRGAGPSPPRRPRPGRRVAGSSGPASSASSADPGNTWNGAPAAALPPPQGRAEPGRIGQEPRRLQGAWHQAQQRTGGVRAARLRMGGQQDAGIAQGRRRHEAEARQQSRPTRHDPPHHPGRRGRLPVRSGAGSRHGRGPGGMGWQVPQALGFPSWFRLNVSLVWPGGVLQCNTGDICVTPRSSCVAGTSHRRL